MARTKKPPAGDDSPEPQLTFEQSLTALQQIVDDLEAGQLGLDESMQRFEQGISLLRSCYGTLETAEQKIEILTGIDADGRPVTEPFDATSTAAQRQETAGRRKQSSATDDAEGAEGSECDPRKRLF